MEFTGGDLYAFLEGRGVARHIRLRLLELYEREVHPQDFAGVRRSRARSGSKPKAVRVDSDAR